MADKILNFTWEAVNNRVAKVGAGAYLTTPTPTPVTTTPTRLLGTFTNVEAEGFEIDGATGKLKYNPTDGLARTFVLIYSGNVEGAGSNDIVGVTIEVVRDSVASIIPGSSTETICRLSASPYPFSRGVPYTYEVGDLIEIQVYGDSSFTLIMAEFTTNLFKFY